MTGFLARRWRTEVAFAFFLVLTLFLSGCGTVTVLDLPETTVANLPTEDLAGPCTYAIRLTEGPPVPPSNQPTFVQQTAVLVIFERLDSLKLFSDPALIAAAQKLHMAMVYAYECDANSFNDLQPLAAQGPGRALFQALNQFAVSVSHPELAKANVFLSGFSAAGYLSVTTAAEFPDRVLGLIPYAPASGYYSFGSYIVSPALAQIPTLILVSDMDVAAGDQEPFFVFLDAWSQGAPWGFASQHAVGHCCVDSIAPLMIPWMNSVYANYTTLNAAGLAVPKRPSLPAGGQVAFQITVDGSFDPFGWQNFYFGTASLSQTATPTEPYQAWMPDATSAQAWLTWVQNPDGNN